MNYDLDGLMDDFEKWDRKNSRKHFIERMERKLHNKEDREYRLSSRRF